MYTILNKNILVKLFKSAENNINYILAVFLGAYYWTTYCMLEKWCGNNINLPSKDQKQENTFIQSKSKLTYSLNWFQKYLNLS